MHGSFPAMHDMDAPMGDALHHDDEPADSIGDVDLENVLAPHENMPSSSPAIIDSLELLDVDASPLSSPSSSDSSSFTEPHNVTLSEEQVHDAADEPIVPAIESDATPPIVPRRNPTRDRRPPHHLDSYEVHLPNTSSHNVRYPLSHSVHYH
ncbi:unnamed protein product [Linum trigynum]|uniref:Uncharacterized protein n=1 Tax=Linum trigynum TaxID=586398 RepID=A0AAV2E4S3_9ROSI